MFQSESQSINIDSHRPFAANHAAADRRPPSLAQVAFGAVLATSILEQIDHGVLLLREQGQVLHANRVAVRELAQHGALRLEQGRLLAPRASDAEALARALAGAARGLRTLLHFDSTAQCLPLVVMPLPLSPATSQSDAELRSGITLALLAKRGGSEQLNIELFARAHSLTLTECAVLKGLSRGLNPAALAQAHGVALCTVRTQISQVRAKTRTGSIRALLDVVNNLPPVVCATELRDPVRSTCSKACLAV